MNRTLTCHRRHLKFLEVGMSGGRGISYHLGNNTLIFSKCNTSINSNSHKALRYKNVAKHANWRAAKLEYNKSFMFLSPLLIISTTKEQERFPVVPRRIFLNHLMQWFCKILSQFLSNIQQINFTSRNHDSDQGIIISASPLLMHLKEGLGRAPTIIFSLMSTVIQSFDWM